MPYQPFQSDQTAVTSAVQSLSRQAAGLSGVSAGQINATIRTLRQQVEALPIVVSNSVGRTTLPQTAGTLLTDSFTAPPGKTRATILAVASASYVAPAVSVANQQFALTVAGSVGAPIFVQVGYDGSKYYVGQAQSRGRAIPVEPGQIIQTSLSQKNSFSGWSATEVNIDLYTQIIFT